MKLSEQMKTSRFETGTSNDPDAPVVASNDFAKVFFNFNRASGNESDDINGLGFDDFNSAATFTEPHAVGTSNASDFAAPARGSVPQVEPGKHAIIFASGVTVTSGSFFSFGLGLAGPNSSRMQIKDFNFGITIGGVSVSTPSGIPKAGGVTEYIAGVVNVETGLIERFIGDVTGGTLTDVAKVDDADASSIVTSTTGIPLSNGLLNGSNSFYQDYYASGLIVLSEMPTLSELVSIMQEDFYHLRNGGKYLSQRWAKYD